MDITEILSAATLIIVVSFEVTILTIVYGLRKLLKLFAKLAPLFSDLSDEEIGALLAAWSRFVRSEVDRAKARVAAGFGPSLANSSVPPYIWSVPTNSTAAAPSNVTILYPPGGS